MRWPWAIFAIKLLNAGLLSCNLSRTSCRRVTRNPLQDMLDRLERRRLSAGELQQVMVLDARLEQWAAMQCAKHRAAVRAALGPRLEARLARRAGGAGAPRSDSLAPGQVERQRSEERARELGREIERLNQAGALLLSALHQ